MEGDGSVGEGGSEWGRERNEFCQWVISVFQWEVLPKKIATWKKSVIQIFQPKNCEPILFFLLRKIEGTIVDNQVSNF